jgi:alkyl sulfatase BDS1-like metallo-beta-lactamase superfamily hydrolase
MGAARELADRLWRGETSTVEHHPLFTFLELEEYAPGLAFVGGFANVAALATDAGLVLVDTGSAFTAPAVHASIRRWSDAPLHTAIFTHGHVDHVMGVGAFEAEPSAGLDGADGPRPRVIAHEAVAARFDRYRATAGWNARINARQFRMPGLAWPTEFRYPDATYRDTLTLTVGGEAIELHHARGETDDHTWLWLPLRRVLATGDLFIWASPNCGNPQKVQRYPGEWAAALRTMAQLGAELLLPGHGPPIEGAARVRQALDETAELLETLHEGTLRLMNEGATLDAVLAEVRAPERLLARPYLRPVYDDPEFIVRNLWRLYGGWWDGNPARLKPPRDGELAGEMAALAGGAAKLVERAQSLSAAGRHALAAQLAEWALGAAPGDEGVARARAEVYRRRAAAEPSLMARSVFTAASEDR